MPKTNEQQTILGQIEGHSAQSATELISNIAEAEAYMAGVVDGTLLALGLRPQDTKEIRARCARMREFTDE